MIETEAIVGSGAELTTKGNINISILLQVTPDQWKEISTYIRESDGPLKVTIDRK